MRLPQRLPRSPHHWRALEEIFAILPGGAGDRPFGRDLDRIIELLGSGWATTVW
jgi:hypothetical protein